VPQIKVAGAWPPASSRCQRVRPRSWPTGTWMPCVRRKAS